MLVLGDMNAKVAEERGKIVGKWKVDGTNETEGCLIGVCAERKWFLSYVF